MTVVKELIRSELDGTLSFGDYTLDTKTKKDGFEFQGDIYKVKTFKEITKLEKNGMFVYESVSGSSSSVICASPVPDTLNEITSSDTSKCSTAVPGTDYIVYMNDMNVGDMKTNLSAKLSVSAELGKESVEIKVVRK